MSFLMSCPCLPAGTLEVDATAALLSIVSILFFVCPYGFAVVATIRVGNLLGAGQTDQAKLTSTHRSPPLTLKLSCWSCALG